jgi:hypothetical protein
MRLEKREMPVVKRGHDEYLVRPVDEFLRDPSDGESARAGGSRFVLFRASEEIFRRLRSRLPVQTKSSLVLRIAVFAPWCASKMRSS